MDLKDRFVQTPQAAIKDLEQMYQDAQNDDSHPIRYINKDHILLNYILNKEYPIWPACASNSTRRVTRTKRSTLPRPFNAPNKVINSSDLKHLDILIQDYYF